MRFFILMPDAILLLHHLPLYFFIERKLVVISSAPGHFRIIHGIFGYHCRKDSNILLEVFEARKKKRM